MSNEDDRGHDLVMPFLPVISNGGPFDDGAFVAGYEMGRLDSLLEPRHLAKHEATIQTANVLQADLIAMRHGYRCETESTDEAPEWAQARFVRTDQESSR